MGELFTKLGINWQSLVFQIINFVILLVILRKFVYFPLLKVLADRKKKIAQSMEQAEEVKNRLQQTQNEYQQMLLKVKQEAQGIREQAESDAEKIRTTKVQETKKEIETLLTKAKRQISDEKDQAIDEVRKESAELLMLTTQKVLRQAVDEQRDKTIIREHVKELMK